MNHAIPSDASPRPLSIRLIASDQLGVLAGGLNALAPNNPFLQADWLDCWWRHYRAPGMELFTLAVADPHGNLLGLAPWYLHRSAVGRRVIRFLGTGEVCSDYLSLLAAPGHAAAVCGALAQWLAGEGADQWDRITLEAVSADDEAVGLLARELAARDHIVVRREQCRAWRLALPPTWDAYLAMLSRDRRTRVKSLTRRVLDTPRANRRDASSEAELAKGLDILCDLHQRRRRSLGQSGCFASTRFESFHRELSLRFLRKGWLRLEWTVLDGDPVAVQYSLLGGDTVYYYQSGIDPDRADQRPGWLEMIGSLRRSIQEGYRFYDFLRGDEPYKAHWRAEPRPLHEVRIIGRHPAARLRHGAWWAGCQSKRLFSAFKARRVFPAARPRALIETASSKTNPVESNLAATN